MKHIKIILTAILLLICYTSYSQQYPGKNSEKYWYYRDRLRFFMTGIGNNAGESLPMVDRTDIYHTPYDKMVIPDDGPNHLGFYLGVLATELKLLSDEGAQTWDTKRELYYAIEALNRLDLANVCINGVCSNNTSLDGILARDDLPTTAVFPNPLPNQSGAPVPLNYMKNVNYVTRVHSVSVYGIPASPSNGTGCTDDAVQLWMTNHGLTNNNTVDDPICQMMSQDHYIRILMGLCLVSHMVDPNASYGTMVFTDGQTNFVAEANSIVHRIVTHFQNNYWLLYRPGVSPGPGMNLAMMISMVQGWGGTVALSAGSAGVTMCAASAITYSAADELQAISLGEFNKLVYRGNTAMKYAYGWAQAASFTTGSNSYFDAFSASPEAITIWKSYTQFSPNSLQNANSATLGIFQGLINKALNSGQSGNMSQMLTLAAIGDSWHQVWGTEVTEDHIKALDADWGFNWNFYTLLWAVLHNQSTTLAQSDFENMLDAAPCLGITQNDPNGWCNRNRFMYGASEEFTTASLNARNGLDYMLLYNLYYIKYRSSLPQYYCAWRPNDNSTVEYRSQFDILNQADAKTYPYQQSAGIGSDNWSTIGSLAHPAYVRAEDYIQDYWTQILPGADVQYRAGNSIELNSAPNGSFFHAAFGCNFHAQPGVASDCDGNGNYSHNVARAAAPPPPPITKPATLEGFNFDTEIYPNPATDVVNVTYVLPKADRVIVTLCDIQGKVLNTGSINQPSIAGQIKLPLQGIAPGIYMLTIQSGGGIQTKKLVIQ